MSILDNRQQGLVSVVVSSYNYQQYLLEALLSIKKQSYSKIELIIIDDGSTDDTENLVREWGTANQDSFINFLYLKLPRNCYSSWALNIGFLISRGEYIIIHDADDISFSNKIEKQLNWLQEHPETDAVGTNIIVQKIGGEYQPDWLSFNRQQIEENYRKHNKHCVSFGTLMFRAEILTEIIGVQKNPDKINDSIFLKEIINHGFIVDNLEEPLINIRLHPGQLSYKYYKNFTKGIPVKEGGFKKIKGRVSVVIPLQNSAKSILRILGLIAVQTYPEIEVIIVDNISSDIVESLVKDWYLQYQQDYPQGIIKDLFYFKLSVELEFFGLYNIGSYLAKGEYIAYQGANGGIVREKIKRQVEFLKNNPNYSVIFTNYRGTNNSNRIDNRTQLRMKVDKLLAEERTGMAVNKPVEYNLNTVLLKSRVIDQTAGMKESKTGQEALEFIYMLLEKGYNIKFLDEVLYYEF